VVRDFLVAIHGWEPGAPVVSGALQSAQLLSPHLKPMSRAVSRGTDPIGLSDADTLRGGAGELGDDLPPDRLARAISALDQREAGRPAPPAARTPAPLTSATCNGGETSALRPVNAPPSRPGPRRRSAFATPTPTGARRRAARRSPRSTYPPRQAGSPWPEPRPATSRSRQQPGAPAPAPARRSTRSDTEQ
jgi:hypothetical protein